MKISSPRIVLITAVLLVAGCGSQPEKRTSTDQENLPELNLNLPAGDCSCDKPQNDFTFLEKGFDALEEGVYLEALQYFQRYQRIEKSETASVEAGIAITYLSILPESPIFDRDAARAAYPALRSRVSDEMKLHGEVQLMQDSLDSFMDMYEQIERLKVTNGSLRAELEKREDAIKRLRDLTLGREPESAAEPGS